MLEGFPLSYRDPLYTQLATAAEEKYGLPKGILDAIRLKGEQSNANQVSSSGAEGVYQFIPSTRQRFIKNYGIDPWSSPQAQTEAAALHLVGDYKRTGSWDESIARYHGGQRPGSSSYKYASRVGDFDKSGNSTMPNPSIFPVMNGVDPLAPEQPTLPTPINNFASPSISLPATAPAVGKKRGGILGALESIFMPNPDSQWAGALRDGLTNAKESQQLYREQQVQKELSLAEANVKLHRMIQQGEFQIVGNNVFHTKPDGSYEMITAPKDPTEKEALYKQWQTTPEGPEKSMLERMLLGAQSDEAIQSQANVAKIRGQSTISAAKERGSFSNPVIPALPPGWTVVK